MPAGPLLFPVAVSMGFFFFLVFFPPSTCPASPVQPAYLPGRMVAHQGCSEPDSGPVGRRGGEQWKLDEVLTILWNHYPVSTSIQLYSKYWPALKPGDKQDNVLDWISPDLQQEAMMWFVGNGQAADDGYKPMGPARCQQAEPDCMSPRHLIPNS